MMKIWCFYPFLLFALVSLNAGAFDGTLHDLRPEDKVHCLKVPGKDCLKVLSREGRNFLENVIPYVSEIKIPKTLFNEKTKEIRFTITKKHPSYHAREISRTYPITELKKGSWGRLLLPVYGLYHGHNNEVRIQIDDPPLEYRVYIETAAPSEESSYGNLKVENSIGNKSERPSFNFFTLKSSKSGVGIMDIDGEIRWSYPVPQTGWANLFDEGRFIMAGYTSLYEVGLDLSVKEYPLQSEQFTDLIVHHGLTKGRDGTLVLASGKRIKDGADLSQVIVLEVDEKGKTFKSWDIGKIIADHMTEQGDDPSQFVRDGDDWFHMNSITYTNKEDNSLILSSRENFIIKIDYDTNKIKWIFGDQNKHWGSFPSLTSLAVTTDDLYPVGQHALSILENDASQLMMYNNGTPSGKNPPGTSEGISYETSSVCSYKINDATRTAELTWRYEIGEKSSHRSSAYRSQDNHFTLIISAHLQKLEILDNRDDARTLLKVLFSEEYEAFDLWNATILQNDLF